jgi:hypothetical protein
VRRATLALLLVGLPGGSALAEEPGPSPHDRAAALLRVMPAPRPEAAFSYELEIFVEGARVGRATLSAESGERGGKPAWKVTDAVDTGSQGGRAFTAWLGPALELLESKETKAGRDGTVETSIRRVETGYEVTSGEGEDASKTTVPTPGPVASSLPGLILFLRHAPKDPAKYAFWSLRPDEAPPLQEVSVEAKGDDAFQTASGKRPTWRVDVARGDVALSLHLDRGDRSLIAITTGQVVMAREGLMKGKGLPPDGPATSAKEVVGRVALAWARADVALLSKTLHWPSLHTQSGSGQSLEEFRRAQEQVFRERMGEPDPEGEEKVSGAMGRAVEKAGPDGTVEVTADFGRGTVTTVAKEIDGAWLVVRLPR